MDHYRGLPLGLAAWLPLINKPAIVCLLATSLSPAEVPPHLKDSYACVPRPVAVKHTRSAQGWITMCRAAVEPVPLGQWPPESLRLFLPDQADGAGLPGSTQLFRRR